MDGGWAGLSALHRRRRIGQLKLWTPTFLPPFWWPHFLVVCIGTGILSAAAAAHHLQLIHQEF